MKRGFLILISLSFFAVMATGCSNKVNTIPEGLPSPESPQQNDMPGIEEVSETVLFENFFPKDDGFDFEIRNWEKEGIAYYADPYIILEENDGLWRISEDAGYKEFSSKTTFIEQNKTVKDTITLTSLENYNPSKKYRLLKNIKLLKDKNDLGSVVASFEARIDFNVNNHKIAYISSTIIRQPNISESDLDGVNSP